MESSERLHLGGVITNSGILPTSMSNSPLLLSKSSHLRLQKANPNNKKVSVENIFKKPKKSVMVDQSSLKYVNSSQESPRLPSKSTFSQYNIPKSSFENTQTGPPSLFNLRSTSVSNSKYNL